MSHFAEHETFPLPPPAPSAEDLIDLAADEMPTLVLNESPMSEMTRPDRPSSLNAAHRQQTPPEVWQGELEWLSSTTEPEPVMPRNRQASVQTAETPVARMRDRSIFLPWFHAIFMAITLFTAGMTFVVLM